MTLLKFFLVILLFDLIFVNSYSISLLKNRKVLYDEKNMQLNNLIHNHNKMSQNEESIRIFKWQSHSYNDLRQYNGLIKKNTKLFKLDFNFENTNKNICFNSLYYDNIVGDKSYPCFVLNHDTPDENNPLYNGFSLLTLITNSKFNNYFKSNITYFALCFKNIDESDCESKELNDLVSKLFEGLNSLAKDFKLNFVIDGDGKVSCVKKINEKYRWSYTWIRDEDPIDALFSDDSSKDYDLYKIFNDSEDKLNIDSELSYGKFGQKLLPLQVWEPSDQENIVRTADLFKKTYSIGGYAWAINIDPKMFEVYVAPSSKESTNLRINGQDGKFVISNNKLILFKNFESNSYLEIYSYNNIRLNYFDIRLDFINKIEFTDIFDIVLFGDDKVLLIDKSGEFRIFKINYSLKLIDLIYREKIINNISYLSCTKISNDKFHLLLVYSTKSNTSKIEFSKLEIYPESDQFKLILFQSKVFDGLETFVIKLNEQNNGMVVVKQLGQINSFLIKYDDAYLNIDLKNSYTFGPGKNITLSVLKNKFILIKDEGYCYNNHNGNISSINKVCDRKEVSTPFSLTYYYGDLSSNEEYVNTCFQGNVISGCFDLGSFPHTELFELNGYIKMLEVHQGLKETDQFDKNIGTPIFSEGLVFDSFSLN